MLLNVASVTALSYGHPFLLSERCRLNVLIHLRTKQLFSKRLYLDETDVMMTVVA
jgi:hypothetical protein